MGTLTRHFVQTGGSALGIPIFNLTARLFLHLSVQTLLPLSSMLEVGATVGAGCSVKHHLSCGCRTAGGTAGHNPGSKPYLQPLNIANAYTASRRPQHPQSQETLIGTPTPQVENSTKALFHCETTKPNSSLLFFRTGLTTPGQVMVMVTVMVFNNSFPTYRLYMVNHLHSGR